MRRSALNGSLRRANTFLILFVMSWQLQPVKGIKDKSNNPGAGRLSKSPSLPLTSELRQLDGQTLQTSGQFCLVASNMVGGKLFVPKFCWSLSWWNTIYSSVWGKILGVLLPCLSLCSWRKQSSLVEAKCSDCYCNWTFIYAKCSKSRRNQRHSLR